jgi:hypothetical protein
MQEKMITWNSSKTAALLGSSINTKIATILGYKETHFRVNTHKPAPLLGQWKNPHTILITLRENP